MGSRSLLCTLLLLKLAEKINWADQPNIRPVCLPARTDKLYTGATATAAGWGYWYKDVVGPGGYPEGLISRDPTNKALQELDMTVITTEVQFCWSPAEVATATLDYYKTVPLQECRQGYVDAGFDATAAQQNITDEMLCVQTEGRKAPCGYFENGIPIIVKEGLNYVQVRTVKEYTSVLNSCC